MKHLSLVPLSVLLLAAAEPGGPALQRFRYTEPHSYWMVIPTEVPRTYDNAIAQLKREGVDQAHLYGADDKVLGGLNSFYLLVDTPETYGLPSHPKLPSETR